MRRIVITGSESTGKTKLASQLAEHYQCKFIPEYARHYIEGLERPYIKQDVENIAKKQIDQYEKMLLSGECAFIDTWLIITKVWLKVVYNEQENWIEDVLRNGKIDLYILCGNDLPWVHDPVRENGGEMRNKLFDMYLEELNILGLPYRVINGQGEERLRNTIFTIEEYFNK
ncbi:MAG: ATP-binding protein [Bacteroidales bacterium]|jgi:NadR type nicotinamide-nucleotide adenylyltransferase|nr:ATP-binding protein [Bacteroidales bacterium]